MSEPEVIALFALVGVVFTAVISVVVASINAKQRATETLAQTLVASLRDELDSVREQVRDNEERIQRLERRDRMWADYVHILRRHITQQKPPPPPEWPAGLDQ